MPRGERREFRTEVARVGRPASAEPADDRGRLSNCLPQLVFQITGTGSRGYEMTEVEGRVVAVGRPCARDERWIGGVGGELRYERERAGARRVVDEQHLARAECGRRRDMRWESLRITRGGKADDEASSGSQQREQIEHPVRRTRCGRILFGPGDPAVGPVQEVPVGGFRQGFDHVVGGAPAGEPGGRPRAEGARRPRDGGGEQAAAFHQEARIPARPVGAGRGNPAGGPAGHTVCAPPDLSIAAA